MQKLLSLYRGLNIRLGSAAVFDQAVVGGANFLTMIFVGRLCGAAELGIFTLATTIWFLVLAFLESLITTPFTVFVHRLDDESRPAYAGSTFVHVLVLAAIAVVVLAVGAGLLYSIEYTRLAVVVAALAVTTPFRLLRNFARRYCYASLNLNAALFLDISVAILQLFALGVLYWLGFLTAAGVFVAIGVAYALVLLFWIIRQKKSFRIDRGKIYADFFKNWGLGRWLMASQLSMIIAAHSLPWVIAFVLNESQTGIYSACVTLVCIGAPLLVAVQNVLAPRSASAFAESGLTGLRRVIKKTTLGLALGMGIFATLLAVGGDVLVVLFFGSGYEGQQTVVALLAVSQLAYALMLGAASGLTVLERSDLLFRSHLIGIFVTVGLAFALIGEFGLPGAAIAQLSGTVVSSVIAICCYRSIVSGFQEKKVIPPPELVVGNSPP